MGSYGKISQRLGDTLSSAKLYWECPKCRAKLAWGYPSREMLEASSKGEIVLCGCLVGHKNYCPRCGTLIFGQSATAMGVPFLYSGDPDTGTTFHYSGKPFVSRDCYQKIITHFKGRSVPLGASETNPILGGLGEFVRYNYGHNLTPRHASHIAAVLRDHGYLKMRGLKPVMLDFT